MNWTRVYKRVTNPCTAFAGVLLAGALAGCSGATSALSPSPAIPSAPAAQQITYTAWSNSLLRVALPSAGCFKASYPSMEWSRVGCSTPPRLLYPLPITGRRAHTNVGDGNDYTIQTGSHIMSSAIGSFPTVTGVTSVKSTPNPAFGDDCECGADSYTLQLNSSFFSSAACNGESNCAAWEQFVYENPPGSSEGQLFIQDWLIPANLSGSIKCPRGKGWESADGGCVQNSPYAVNIPNQSVTNLGKLVETGDAASSGDSVYLAVGTTVYGMKNVQSGAITDLYANWKGAEFNIVGNAGGSIAEFNSGSTITVGLEGDDAVTTAPTCEADSGTTGESSNLSFVSAPTNPAEETYPSILFTESNASGGGSASCDALAAL
jgi:hypothetical protein